MVAIVSYFQELLKTREVEAIPAPGQRTRRPAIIAAWPSGPSSLMQIGFSINEILCLLTLASGACWLVWRRRLRREPAPERKPFWLSLGAELFVVIGLMFTCRVALADWPKVPSSSMEPTLRVGDYLLVNHLPTARACPSPTPPSSSASRSAATWWCFATRSTCRPSTSNA
jgi:hypothetical protein